MAHLSADNGLTVEFSTHDSQHALSIADHALLMITACECRFGPTEVLLTPELLEMTYQVEMLGTTLKSHSGELVRTMAPIFSRLRLP